LIGYSFSALWLWLPLIVVLSFSFAYALGLFFALLSPFIADVRTAVPVLFQLLFWMTPIIYLPSIIPEQYRYLVELNPFASIVYSFQQVIFFKEIPSINIIAIILMLTLTMLVCTYYLYGKLEKDIRDLI
jgi:lipopolysaccharide transport system permease protein